MESSYLVYTKGWLYISVKKKQNSIFFLWFSDLKQTLDFKKINLYLFLLLGEIKKKNTSGEGDSEMKGGGGKRGNIYIYIFREWDWPGTSI